MNPNMDGQPTPQETINYLQAELQDAQLVIGQQQMQMLKQHQALQNMQQRINELEAQTEDSEIKVGVS